MHRTWWDPLGGPSFQYARTRRGHLEELHETSPSWRASKVDVHYHLQRYSDRVKGWQTQMEGDTASCAQTPLGPWTCTCVLLASASCSKLPAQWLFILRMPQALVVVLSPPKPEAPVIAPLPLPCHCHWCRSGKAQLLGPSLTHSTAPRESGCGGRALLPKHSPAGPLALPWPFSSLATFSGKPFLSQSLVLKFSSQGSLLRTWPKTEEHQTTLNVYPLLDYTILVFRSINILNKSCIIFMNGTITLCCIWPICIECVT